MDIIRESEFYMDMEFLVKQSNSPIISIPSVQYYCGGISIALRRISLPSSLHVLGKDSLSFGSAWFVGGRR